MKVTKEQIDAEALASRADNASGCRGIRNSVIVTLHDQVAKCRKMIERMVDASAGCSLCSEAIDLLAELDGTP